MKQSLTNNGKLVAVLLALTMFVGSAAAVPKLDAVSFDPAFVSAGDTVNISANIHEPDYPDKNWDSDKKLKVVLKPGNKLAEDYVTIVEDRDESIGFLYPEGVWNQNFRVKVDSDAPTGPYKFELHITYEDSSGEDLAFIREFTMPVEKEGVELTMNTLQTDPAQPRPGDDYVTTSIQVTNTGNKPVEEIELIPDLPEGIQPAYSEDEKFFIGRLNAGETRRIDMGLKLDEDLHEGRHNLRFNTTFEDTDSNSYTNTLVAALRVEGRPDLELADSNITMKAGETGTLRLKIKNTGDQDAESVTARVITERTQPFSLVDRSDYIGEIKSGETAEAVLEVEADRTASMKTHELKIQLRSSGDSDEGDHSTYTFTETSKVKIDGRTSSPLLYVGAIGALLVLGFLVYRFRGGETEDDREEQD